MNFNVSIDYKFVVALGVSVAGIIFAVKMSPEQAKEVTIKVVDACKEYAVSNH